MKRMKTEKVWVRTAGAQTQQETHGLKAERYWKRIIN